MMTRFFHKLPKIPPAYLAFSSVILTVSLFISYFFQWLVALLDGSISTRPINPSFFLPTMVRPEPYKIPVYLVMMTLMAVGSIGFRKQISLFLVWLQKNKNLPYIFAVLLLFFLWRLGGFPLWASDQVTVARTLVSIVYTLFWAMVFIFLPKIVRKKLETLAVVLLVVAVTYMPTFPVSLFDYSYLIGPASAVASSKVLYVQEPSQYGLGSILLFASLEKILPGSLLQMSVGMWALYVVEVLLLYFFFRSFIGSFKAALLVVVAAITLSFFSIVSIPFGIPQSGAFRWTLFIAAFLLVFYGEQKNDDRLLFLIAVLSFLVVDVGIAISISLLLYWGLRWLAKNLSLRNVVKKTLIYCGGLLVAYLFFMVISLVLSGQIVNIELIFHTLSQYGGQGFGMLPLADRTFFWLYLLTMFASFVTYSLNKKETAWSKAVLLSSLLFMTGAIYMVGRSHPHNLFNISPLWLLNLFILLTPLFKKYQRALIPVLFIALIAVPSFFRGANVAHLLREKVGRLTIPQLPAKLRTDFTVDFERDLRTLPKTYVNETRLLQETFPQPHQQIVVLALNSTYFHYLSGKPSLLWADPLNTIVQQEELDHALQPIHQYGCPEIIALDPRCANKTTCNRPPNEGIMVAHDRVYEGFTKLCGSYVPFRCAGILCVARRLSPS